MMDTQKSEWQNALEEIRATADGLDSILSSATDSLVVTDKRDRIVLVNRAAEKLFGIEAGKMIDRTLSELLAGAVLFAVHWDKNGNAGDARCFDIELTARDTDNRRALRVTEQPVYDVTGKEIEGVVTRFHDISRQRKLERLKSEFVSAAAHELRTPLTSIRGFSELLLERNVSEDEQKRYLRYINQQSKQLTSVINELLDVSGAETGDGAPVFPVTGKPGQSGGASA